MKPKGIIIHCSDSPQGRGDDAATIHKWHLEKGWDGIGYHKVILEDGTIENGRPLFWNGSHAKGFNDTHIGICLIGEDSFTEQQLNSLSGLVSQLMVDYNIHIKSVVGHYQVNKSKTCPNFNVSEFLYNYVI